MSNFSSTIKYPENLEPGVLIFGNNDRYLKEIEDHFRVNLTIRDNEIKIAGESETDVSKAKELTDCLIARAVDNERVNTQQFNYFLDLISDGKKNIGNFSQTICYTFKGKPIVTKTIGQSAFINSTRRNDIVFSIGPAGTGKTYLAVALAIKALKSGEVERIILTRPAVEAGESLGFLPGDLKEKIDPYLKPLYDALFDIMGSEAYERNVQRGNIEIAPLAYMRGRTLNNSFIILDEAQNTTREQMKMFLTRLGDGSRAVVTGDITQVDLPHGKKSGLIYSQKILKDVEGVDFVHLTKRDVVRNPLVQRIIEAYEKFEGKAAD